jgi:hypothetical protein
VSHGKAETETGWQHQLPLELWELGNVDRPICPECRQRELELAAKAKEALPVKNNIDTQPANDPVQVLLRASK